MYNYFKVEQTKPDFSILITSNLKMSSSILRNQKVNICLNSKGIYFLTLNLICKS